MRVNEVTTWQRLPAEFKERLVEFQCYVIKLRHGNLLSQIRNTDQTLIYFGMPSRTTVATKGAKDVHLFTTGHEHTRFTAMLRCKADRWKLPLYIVFRRNTIPKGEVFPKKVIIRANEKGFINEGMVKEWFEMVWVKRPGADLKPPNMLVLDPLRGHICPGVKAIQEAGTELLQPLNVAVNKPFKVRIAAFYKEWLVKDDAAKTPTGRSKKLPSAKLRPG
ncbi:POGO family transposase [Ixodes scapularis]|uniref:POGO family transposase n=1 Tax=Ixodes scapularis TaxID=6945 RepID=B7Q2Z4_IXOSC|nr:POGO family transposase [Ixodes scapularis]|eukprot:XP_002411092.1 POGO family transposase [Ixodes scapularis]